MAGREFYSGRTNARGFKITEEIKCCLCNDDYKLLDSPVFSDKDNKPLVPSHDPSMWDAKSKE